jgi:crispr-associated protein, family
MQYFSFIGTGGPNGYDEINYFFDNDPSSQIKSQFIQEAIIKKHADIEHIFIFATEIAREKYGNFLLERLNPYNKPLDFIAISENDTFEVYVSKLLKTMKESEKVIIDITHSFRSIPMKLLFALRYIELTKNVQIKHLYYGRKVGDTGEIVDLIQDYALQKISELLSQFDRTLMINSTDVDNLFAQKDERIERFISSLANFNKMIEQCEFDRTLTVIRRIIESCNGIINRPESYSLIQPVVASIKNKFAIYNNCNNNVSRKIELVKVIMAHNRKQVAITFIDQLFREELIRNTLMPDDKNFSLEAYISKNSFGRHEQLDVYNLSQYLILNTYRIRTVFGSSDNDKYSEVLYEKEKNIQAVKAIIKRHKMCDSIKRFYGDIRNHINHGQSITGDVDTIMHDMVGYIELLGKRE